MLRSGLHGLQYIVLLTRPRSQPVEIEWLSQSHCDIAHASERTGPWAMSFNDDE